MILTHDDFKEGTAFELYVLEKVWRTIDKNVVDTDVVDTIIDLRFPKTHISSTLNENLCAGAVNHFKDQLTPLLFGAAWKALDLLIEFALHKAGCTPKNNNNWLISEKQQHAVSGRGDQSVLGCSQPVWEALLSAYANTVEHRHCLVHRKAKVNEVTGMLEGTDKNGQPLQPLTREHQVAFAEVAILAVRGVLCKGGIERRAEDHLKHQLDQLTVHTGKSAFGVSGGSRPIDIRLVLYEENGCFFLDMTGVLEKAKKCILTTHYNIVVDIPDGSGRTLFAYAENCPQGKSKIDLAALPAWLTYR